MPNKQNEVIKLKENLIMGKSVRWWFRAGLLVASHPHLMSRRVLYNTRRFISDRSSSFGYYNYPHRIIFLAGMAMSATTWMKNLLARVPGYYTRFTPMPHDIAVNGNICSSAFKHVPKHGYTLIKTHLKPTQENLECILHNGVEKVVITYRDLRDVAIARYHRLMEFPNVKLPGDPHYIDYRRMIKDDVMDHNLKVIASDYVPWIRRWFEIASKNSEQYHFVKFENLKKDTKDEFKKVLTFYGIELPEKKIEKIIEAAKGKENVRKNITAAKILPKGYASNFRSGKIGNWRDELTNTQIEKCKNLLGSALIELGYEKDMNW